MYFVNRIQLLCCDDILGVHDKFGAEAWSSWENVR